MEAGPLLFRGSTKIFLKQRPRVPKHVMACTPAAVDVFAPGHIGELTQVVPAELVDSVLEETRRRERRLRDVPSRVGVYFVLALGLFEHLGARLVWEKLVGGLDVAAPRPLEKALRDLRRRLGATPLERLFGVLAGPLGEPSTPGCVTCAGGLSPSTAAAAARSLITSGTAPGWVG
ncbi:transposase domain-containing protein [Streptomyces sp. NPDC002928]|uniref:transposase domain-containing protein n=1 Tax=Streptomyces sp. NPDC002928 TaxID=3154440 RepID=UPI0033BA3AFF